MFYRCMTVVTHMSDLAVNSHGRETGSLCKFTVGQEKKLWGYSEGTVNVFKHRLNPFPFSLSIVNKSYWSHGSGYSEEFWVDESQSMETRA